MNIMKRQIIRLTEQDLHNIIKESVNRILNESSTNEGIGHKLALAGMLLGSPVAGNADTHTSSMHTHEITTDLLRNSRRGTVNNDIETFLNNIKNYVDFSSRLSTSNMKFFGRNELKLQNDFMSKMSDNETSKYKLFWTEDGMVLMPINYTVKDVKNDLFTLNLGNFARFNK
jgi:hypothetical protein